MTDFFPLEAAVMAGPLALIVAIVLATFVSEDLTCVTVGLLIAAGKVAWLPALAGCFAGIVLGDFGVWLIGWTGGRSVLRWQWAKRLLPDAKLAELSGVLCSHSGRATVTSRFLPGTRVPLFLAAGILGTCPYRFLPWAFVAAMLWTPLLVFGVALSGASLGGFGWVAFPLVGVTVFIAIKTFPKLTTRVGRAKLIASVSKLWRWEFWPAWVFYVPIVPWFALLAVRYRSLTVWTAANPGIPAGGVVGESKADVLAQIPAEFAVPTVLVPAGEHGVRLGNLRKAWETWGFPLVLKPDQGYRGAGVRKVGDAVAAEKYLLATPGAVVVQPFHPGPFEAGVFYYRIPGEPRGRIFSVTDKVFPAVVGDGASTLADLIWSHPRYRMQAATFLGRHAASADRILSMCEAFPLAMAGNHCQGTLFRDGSRLITQEIEAAFDRLAQSVDGFFIGRFDVRYADEAAFRQGRGFAVLELNGVTSESTNLYDPTWPIWRAYRTLFRQWAILFQIGDRNRHVGHRPLGVRELVSLLRTFYRDRTPPTPAD